MLTNSQNELITIIAPLVSSLVTWYLTKRKFQKTQEEETRTAILAQNLDIYQDMLNDLEARYRQQIKERDEYIKELLERLARWSEEHS